MQPMFVIICIVAFAIIFGGYRTVANTLKLTLGCCLVTFLLLSFVIALFKAIFIYLIVVLLLICVIAALLRRKVIQL